MMMIAVMTAVVSVSAAAAAAVIALIVFETAVILPDRLAAVTT